MNRRTFLQLSLMAALSGGTPALAKSTRAASVKKGLGLGTQSEGWADKLKEMQINWFYTWGPKAPSGIPDGTSFIPMIWGLKGKKENIAGVGQAAKALGIKELLGFNEPDQTKQANLSVEEALAAWPLLMKTGLRLGSPGCVQPDNDWMKSFMAAAKRKKLRIDFVCVHNYGGPSPDPLIKRLESIHKLYGKPIWLTEFAVGDWEAPSAGENRHKPDAVLRFMEKVLPRLERLDFLERYAWFPASPKSTPLGTSALYDDAGKLTRLGQCYRDI